MLASSADPVSPRRSLSGEDVDDETLRALAHAAQRHLRRLQLSCPLSQSPGGALLLASLGRSCALVRLQLQLDSEAEVFALASSLRSNRTLRELSLPLSPMSSAGAAALCASLEAHPRLEALRVENARLSSSAARSFGALAARSGALAQVRLEFENSFGASQACAAAQFHVAQGDLRFRGPHGGGSARVLLDSACAELLGEWAQCRALAVAAAFDELARESRRGAAVPLLAEALLGCVDALLKRPARVPPRRAEDNAARDHSFTRRITHAYFGLIFDEV